uniref:Immunoglobulin V-set domain-containing protein n=1 Tax=Sinocyclocheilus rhinocerous TaxID=307959 RepID=A0A673MGD7_9TELE
MWSEIQEGEGNVQYSCRRIFTVTITNLRTQDEGQYWCGVDRTLTDDYSEILLLVKQGNKITLFIPNVLFFANLSVLSFCLFVCVVILGNPI